MESAHPVVPTARERLDQLGPRSLSETDLVAILLGPTAGTNSVQAAALRLVDTTPLSELAWASADELQQISGIGPTRAAALVAAFELGRRASWAPPKRGDPIRNPARVHELLRNVAHADREEFWTVLLDVRARLIKTVRTAEGSLSVCPVHPRDVLREAVRCGAHSVIFAHSHPSGDPRPSAEDRTLTERLRAAAELLGIVARDHVVIGTEGYYSFVEAGTWPS